MTTRSCLSISTHLWSRFRCACSLKISGVVRASICSAVSFRALGRGWRGRWRSSWYSFFWKRRTMACTVDSGRPSRMEIYLKVSLTWPSSPAMPPFRSTRPYLSSRIRTLTVKSVMQCTRSSCLCSWIGRSLMLGSRW